MSRLRRFYIKYLKPRPGPFQGNDNWMAELIEWCAIRMENHEIYMSGWHDDATNTSPAKG